MKVIKIIKKSHNKMSWANRFVGETFEVFSERGADDVNNITGGDEYTVRVEQDGADPYLGCIEKQYVEVQNG